jgi:hypothetical protein
MISATLRREEAERHRKVRVADQLMIRYKMPNPPTIAQTARSTDCIKTSAGIGRFLTDKSDELHG